jgi:hypothetical protein
MVASPKGLRPEKDCAARASSIYKRQTRRLIKEGAPQKQDRNWQTRHQDLLTVSRNVTLTLTSTYGTALRQQ